MGIDSLSGRYRQHLLCMSFVLHSGEELVVQKGLSRSHAPENLERMASSSLRCCSGYGFGAPAKMKER